MQDKDTVYDLLFDQPTAKYTDEKYVAEKLNIVARRGRKISGNWNQINSPSQILLKLLSDEARSPVYQWIEKNYMNKEW